MPLRRIGDHVFLTLGALVMAAPLVMVFAAAATRGGIGGLARGVPGSGGLAANLDRLEAMTRAARAPGLGAMVADSLAIAAGVAVLGTAIAFLAAYAMVFFGGRAGRVVFWLTLATLYFPIEARMLPTFGVAAHLGLTDTLAGLVLPILPLALATLVLRQHLKTFPPEIQEAARLDGAGPVRFLAHFVLPLSLVPLGAVLVITFMIGWNQYLWPLIVTVENAYFPLMRGLNLAGSGSGPSMVLAAASVLPPLVLVLAFLRLMPRVTALRP